MDDDQFHFDGYDWKNKVILGQGGFGRVFKVRNLKTNQCVAIKQMSMAKFDEEYKLNALKTQINVMKETASQYTVRMFDYRIGKRYTYIILELCDTDLKKELQANGDKLPEDVCIQIFIQILEGFKVLLNKGYIHRDVKPQNVLSKNKLHKLADYGFTRKIDINKSVLNEICGTPLYMAPQLLYSKDYSSKCDIWSLGIMFYEMLFGYSPWPSRHLDVYKRCIVSKPVAFPYNCGIGENTRNFLQGCLKIQENQRFSWNDVFSHPLISKREKGKPIKNISIPTPLEKILVRVQESTSRKCINVKESFIKFEKYLKIDKKLFNQFITDLDPQISTYESQAIFEAADLSKDGFVNLNEFEELYLKVDYRPLDDIASRRIQQIVEMAQARNLNIRQFFDLFDKDKSEEIDQGEFFEFIRYIAPKINPREIEQMWIRFDEDKSGKITMKEFVDEMTRGVPNQGSQIVQNRERAKRNLDCLRSFMRENKVSAGEIFKKANVHNKNCLKIQEFGPFVQSINYIITKEEISDMFSLLDGNHSGSIQVQELQQILSY